MTDLATSLWAAFQHADENAYYEYVCKCAGISAQWRFHAAATARVGTRVRMSYVTLYVANCKTSRVRWLFGSRSSSRIVK